MNAAARPRPLRLVRIVRARPRLFVSGAITVVVMAVLAVAAPWHIVAGLRNPPAGEAKGFFWFYFVNEHFLRYINKRFPRDYDTVPLLLFWALALLFLLSGRYIDRIVLVFPLWVLLISIIS